MKELNSYRPIDLTEDQRVELEDLMQRTNTALLHDAERLGIKKVLVLRDAFRTGTLTPNSLSGDTACLLHRMVHSEDLIIRGYIRLAHDFCKQSEERYNFCIGVSYSDYLQESAKIIYDSMYRYDGSTRFSTFVVTCIRHHLRDFARKQITQTTLDRFLRKLRKHIRGLMTKDGIGFNQVAAQIGGDQVIPDHVLAQVRDTIYSSDNQERDPNHVLRREKRQILSEALDTAGLSTMERDLVTLHLQGDSRSEYRLQTRNPKTNLPYSKVSLGNSFNKACQKVRQVLGVKGEMLVA